MSKFTHPNYDGKHWIKGTAEYALDNELNRLNKQIVKYAKGGATNSATYKRMVTDITKLSGNRVHFTTVNGVTVPQAKRGAAIIAEATKQHKDTLPKKIAKSKSHATFDHYKQASKKLGLTPNELSFLSNESAAYYEAMYAEDDDDNPLDYLDDSDTNFKPPKGDTPTYHQNPHTFNADPFIDIHVEDIISHHESGNGFVNVETGEYFDNYNDALKSFDETMAKIQSGEWHINKAHFGENIDWSYYNQFKRKKEW